ncbi:uncharacterized mitochondrial protein AtMg00310-like [Rosa chinensis]|uniref:uncharacterized mitochondrial protein AtMg00310-like n=1 Tax=Rosa chinensis TaxID=74649 RepID=UPI000D0871F1|nr:uncharacterized mitochondrial protein AtMg00310-like [Rosa chinensis]
MSIFLLPKTLYKAINSDLANFWWGYTDTKSKIHWNAWPKLCEAKSKGGIGFREFNTFNKALLAKQCWRILKNPNALWVKVLKGRYFPNSSFLSAKNGRRPSWGWNSLIAGRDTISNHAFWQINNGRLIDV